MILTTHKREPVRRHHLIANATPREVYDVLVDFAAYPEMFPELGKTRVLARTGSIVRVEFRVKVVLAVRYVLDLACEPRAPSVDWTFVDGEVVSGSVGSWHLSDDGGGTAVDYCASLDVCAPLPRCILRHVTDGLVGAALPRMFGAIEHEVRRRALTS